MVDKVRNRMFVVLLSTIIASCVATLVGLHQLGALPVLHFQMDDVESVIEDHIQEVGDAGALTKHRMLEEMLASRRRQLHENLRAQDGYRSEGKRPPPYFSREEADLRGDVINLERELK